MLHRWWITGVMILALLLAVLTTEAEQTTAPDNFPESTPHLKASHIQKQYPAQMALGRQLLWAWDLTAADSAAYNAIQLNPVLPDAYHLLGDIALIRQQFREARQWFRTALALHTTTEPPAALYHKMGRCLWNEGSRELALYYLLHAHQTSDGLLAGALVDSLLAQRDVDPEQALTDLYEQYSTDPSYTIDESVQRYIEDGYLIEMESLRFSAALQTARKLMQLDSTEVTYQMYAIEALMNLGQLAEAFRLADDMSESAFVQLLKARLYLRADSLEQALASYRRATHALPRSIDLAMEIGELYFSTGQNDSALVYFRRACQLGDQPACEQVKLIQAAE